MTKRIARALIYVGSVVGANWLTERYGLVSIGLGLVVAAGTFAAAVALLARNLGQDALGRLVIVLLMAVGVGLSWWLSTPALAVASAAAFALSETADMTVYTALRSAGRPRALLCAGVLGAVVDTFVFLHLAGFPLTPSAVFGQLLVKAGLSAVVAIALGVRTRAVLREPVHAEGA